MTCKLALSIHSSDLYTHRSSIDPSTTTLSAEFLLRLSTNVLRPLVLESLIEGVSVADRGDVVAVPPGVAGCEAEAHCDAEVEDEASSEHTGDGFNGHLGSERELRRSRDWLGGF